MPFTPFHFGPGLAFGLLFRKYFHTPTFILANLIVDIEPFIILVLSLDLPLHWFFHSLVGALTLGLILSFFMFMTRNIFRPLFMSLKIEFIKNDEFKSYLLAGILGVLFHIFLDYPIYSDIKPFFPIDFNPFYNPSITHEIYLFCILTFIIGLIEYIIIIIKKTG